MALLKEIWIQDIQENLFPQSSFLTRSVDDSGYASFKTIHVPQAGSNPGVSLNRSSLPATPAQRTDADFTYNVDQFTTDPILITDLESAQISYNKRQSITGQHLEVLTQRVGDQTLVNWAPATTKIVRTTGNPDGSALAPLATGTRKLPTATDFAALAASLDADNVPRQGRILLMNPFMYAQLFTINGFTTANAFGKTTLPEGIMDRVFGFDIMVRPGALVYDSTPALKAFGAAGAATDNLAALAWHPSFVSRALTGIDIFSDFGDNGNGKPEYYGGILSAKVWFGAKYRRADVKGVAALVQG